MLGIESVFAIAPSADRPSAVARMSRVLVPVAHAHGGHDDASGRRIRAELLDVIALDVLADEPQRMAAESAEAGDIETMKRVRFSLSEGGTSRIAVRPSEWFRSAEFDRLPEADDDQPSQITPDNQVGRAWAIGLRSPAAFDVSWDRAKD